jgi:hypothetical protein
MAMDQGVFDGLFAVLNPLSPNAAKSKEVELKFGPMVARTRNCEEHSPISKVIFAYNSREQVNMTFSMLFGYWGQATDV